MPNQIAKVKIIADFPFSYESKILTKQLQERRRQMVAPVYVVDDAHYEKFSIKISKLKKELDEFRDQVEGLTEQEQLERLERFTHEFNEKNNLKLNTEDLIILFTKVNKHSIHQLLDEALFTLKEILREGVYSRSESILNDEPNQPHFFNIEIEGGKGESHVHSEVDALRYLRMNLWGIEFDAEISKALFHIFKQGVVWNLNYNAEKTREKIEHVAETTTPVVVQVAEAQMIINRGELVTMEQHEQLTVYRQKMKGQEKVVLGLTTLLIYRILFAFGILLFGVFYLHLIPSRIKQSKRSIFMAIFVMLINLLIVRLLLQFGESEFVCNSVILPALLPYACPVYLGAIIITIMVDAGMGILMAIVVSACNSVMMGSSLDYFLVGLISSMLGVYYCRDMRFRRRVIETALIAASGFAVFGAVSSLLNDVDLVTVGKQMMVSQGTGVVAGLLAISVFPLLEGLFRYTTDISLLELADHNHPLLRKLQMMSPGTYHHCLMVANLAERAAIEIGANSLLCRCGALYHDVGKILKSEYFTENQQNSENPHNEKSPSMSALIIKSHLKEGVDIAKRHKLPKVLIEIMQQHHGTMLIQYFYQKALKLQEEAIQNNLQFDNEEVNESVFRYEGPRPRFRESAVVFLADSIEAASRSMKKFTPQHVEDLVDQLVKDRIEDGQLDECPITFQEISRIKKSFVVTVINMFHSRVSYPHKSNDHEQTEGRTTAYQAKQSAQGT